MPITNAPPSLASCTAAEPMPLPTELISTVSPARRPPRVNSMCHAVPKAISVATAASSESASGTRIRCRFEQASFSAYPPDVEKLMNPGETERRASGLAVDAAAARVEQVRQHAVADLPAGHALAERRDSPDDLDTEDERRLDGEARNPLADVHVQVVQRRGEDVEDDFTGPGCGSGTSSNWRTSRPPNSWNTTAFTPRPPHSNDG